MMWRTTYLIVPGLVAIAMALPVATSPQRPSLVVTETTPEATPTVPVAKVHPLTAEEVASATAILR